MTKAKSGKTPKQSLPVAHEMTKSLAIVLEIAQALGNVMECKISRRKVKGLRRVEMWVRE